MKLNILWVLEAGNGLRSRAMGPAAWVNIAASPSNNKLATRQSLHRCFRKCSLQLLSIMHG